MMTERDGLRRLRKGEVMRVEAAPAPKAKQSKPAKDAANE